MTLCPKEATFGGVKAFTFDGIMQANHGVWTGMMVFAAAYSIFSSLGKVNFPCTSALAAAPVLWALALGKSVHRNTNVEVEDHPDFKSPSEDAVYTCPSTFVVLWLLLTIGGRGPVLMHQATDADMQQDVFDRCSSEMRSQCAFTLRAAGALRVAECILVFIWWLQFRLFSHLERFLKGQSDDPDRTHAFFVVAYAYLISRSLDNFVIGIGINEMYWKNILAGIGWAFLPVSIGCVGYRRSSLLLRRVFEFEKNRAAQEGRL